MLADHVRHLDEAPSSNEPPTTHGRVISRAMRPGVPLYASTCMVATRVARLESNRPENGNGFVDR